MQIEAMKETDLAAVLAVQAQCYSADVLESEECFRAKIKSSPQTCFVARKDNLVVAYLISIPLPDDGVPPMLNAPVCYRPVKPAYLHLHDLAVAPQARNSGAGRMLVEHYFEKARALGIRKCCLVAVQNSSGYWARYGFRAEEGIPAVQDKLVSYGAGAAYMVLEL